MGPQSVRALGVARLGGGWGDESPRRSLPAHRDEAPRGDAPAPVWHWALSTAAARETRLSVC